MIEGKLCTYRGPFENNKKHTNKEHPKGIMSYKDGPKYIGGWKDDKRDDDGNALLIFQDKNPVYQGNFKNDKFHGEGAIQWSNNTWYKGQWKNGKKEGHGVMVYQNKMKYEGEFKNDERNGKGELIWNGSSTYKKYVGEFKDNKMHSKEEESEENKG